MRRFLLVAILACGILLSLCGCTKSDWSNVVDVTFTQMENVDLVQQDITNISEQTIQITKIAVSFTGSNGMKSESSTESDGIFLAPGETFTSYFNYIEGETYQIKTIRYRITD